MRILVVDDDVVARTKMSALFSLYGKCDTAVNGLTGLKMFEDAQKRDGALRAYQHGH